MKQFTLSLLVLTLTLGATFLTGCLNPGDDLSDEFEAEREVVLTAFVAAGYELPTERLRDVTVTAVPDTSVVCDTPTTSCMRYELSRANSWIVIDRDYLAGHCKQEASYCYGTPSETLIHEYTHAAFGKLGVNTGEHPTFFTAVENSARRALAL